MPVPGTSPAEEQPARAVHRSPEAYQPKRVHGEVGYTAYARSLSSLLPARVKGLLPAFADVAPTAIAEEQLQDKVLGTRFGAAKLTRGGTKRLLCVGYDTGYQIWDTTGAESTRGKCAMRQVAAVRDGIAVRDVVVLAACPGSAPMAALLSGRDCAAFPLAHVKIVDLRDQSLVTTLRFRQQVNGVVSSPTHLIVLLQRDIVAFRAGSFEMLFGQRCAEAVISSGITPADLGSSWLAFAGTSAPPAHASQRGDGSSTSSAPSSSSAPSPQPAAAAGSSWGLWSVAKDIASGLYYIKDVGASTVSMLRGSDAPPPSTQPVVGLGSAAPATPASRSPAPALELASPATSSPPRPPALPGVVQVLDVSQRRTVACFRSFKAPLAALRFDASGRLLASVSVEGQSIHVHQLLPASHAALGEGHGAAPRLPLAAQLLFVLERGLSHALVPRLEFSARGQWLAATSAHGTSHLFSLLDASAARRAAGDEAAAAAAARQAAGVGAGGIAAAGNPRAGHRRSSSIGSVGSGSAPSRTPPPHPAPASSSSSSSSATSATSATLAQQEQLSGGQEAAVPPSSSPPTAAATAHAPAAMAVAVPPPPEPTSAFSALIGAAVSLVTSRAQPASAALPGLDAAPAHSLTSAVPQAAYLAEWERSRARQASAEVRGPALRLRHLTAAASGSSSSGAGARSGKVRRMSSGSSSGGEAPPSSYLGTGGPLGSGEGNRQRSGSGQSRASSPGSPSGWARAFGGGDEAPPAAATAVVAGAGEAGEAGSTGASAHSGRLQTSICVASCFSVARGVQRVLAASWGLVTAYELGVSRAADGHATVALKHRVAWDVTRPAAGKGEEAGSFVYSAWRDAAASGTAASPAVGAAGGPRGGGVEDVPEKLRAHWLSHADIITHAPPVLPLWQSPMFTMFKLKEAQTSPQYCYAAPRSRSPGALTVDELFMSVADSTPLHVRGAGPRVIPLGPASVALDGSEPPGASGSGSTSGHPARTSEQGSLIRASASDTQQYPAVAYENWKSGTAASAATLSLTRGIQEAVSTALESPSSYGGVDPPAYDTSSSEPPCSSAPADGVATGLPVSLVVEESYFATSKSEAGGNIFAGGLP